TLGAARWLRPEALELAGLRRVQAAGLRVRGRGQRRALPGPGHTDGVRRAVPRVRARVLRVLRSLAAPEHRRARAPVRGARAHPQAGRRPVPVHHRLGAAVSGGRRCARGCTSADEGGCQAMTHRSVEVPVIARVEGEGALHITVEDHEIRDLRLEIYEPPRFFEAFLAGRSYAEVPDITARICGICPVAYQMSSIHGLERLFDVRLPAGIRELRRLLYCGEWIESHVLHVFLLAAPDFMGFDNAIEMAKAAPALVKKALEIKRIGNDLMAVIGGREIHPVSPRVGGFSKAPRRRDLEPFLS